MVRTLCISFLLLLVSGLPLQAQEQSRVFTGARIMSVAEAPIENGVMVVEDGQIVAVGAEGEVEVPSGAEEVDASGQVIIPGLIDTHSHIGRGDGGDASAAVHPDARILDAIDVRHPSLMRARAGGITTVNVMPGSGHLLSGQTAYLKLRDGTVIDDLLFCENPTTEICGGIKMANGTNSIREQGPFPGTRGRSAAIQREMFVEAEEYRRQVEQAGDDPEEMPSRDLANEALREVLDGERIVHFHTHTHEDIMTVLRLQEEFGFDVVLHHVSEAWKTAEEIAEAGVPSSIILLDAPGGKLETTDISFENAPALEEAGADVGFHTDDYITDSRLFLRMAAFGVRAGMSEEAALEALTLAGARMVGMEERIGSLEPGKDADFVVLSGEPFSVYTHVLETWVEGERVFDRSDEEHLKFATGGYDVYVPSLQHIHEH